MSEARAIQGIRVESDPLEPDWRFRLLSEDAVVGEVFFDADNGWDVADRPRGWTLRWLEEGVPAEVLSKPKSERLTQFLSGNLK